jgi:two-component system, NarL family, nitrate/nitrite response regulator NarL
MSGLVNVIVVAPSRLFREGLRLIVSGTRFTADSMSASFADALASLRAGTVQADLIVGDLPPNSAEEYQAISAIHREFPNIKIVGLTRASAAQEAERAVQHGVCGLFSKDLPAEALRHALELVVMGGTIGPIAVNYTSRVEAAPTCSAPQRPTLKYAAPVAIAKQPERAPGILSDREEQALECLVGGMSNKLIARHLDITEATVKVHLRSLLRKLKVRNRTQAAIWAMQNATAPSRPAARPVADRALSRFGAVPQSAVA